jgi:hypothetical protein
MKKNSKHCSPVAEYLNAYIKKKQIFRETKGKSGVYRWTNLKSGKSYIGSGINLYNRLRYYYVKKAMMSSLKTGKSYIYSSLLKNGHSKFKL